MHFICYFSTVLGHLIIIIINYLTIHGKTLITVLCQMSKINKGIENLGFDLGPAFVKWFEY